MGPCRNRCCGITGDLANRGRANELFPSCVLAPFGRRRQAMPPQNVADRLIRYAMAKIGQGSHDAIIAPSGILPRDADYQGFQFRCDPRPAGIGAMPRSIKLACDQFRYQPRMVSGLATQVTCSRALRPRLFPISASVDRSGSDRRIRAGKVRPQDTVFGQTRSAVIKAPQEVHFDSVTIILTSRAKKAWSWRRARRKEASYGTVYVITQ